MAEHERKVLPEVKGIMPVWNHLKNEHWVPYSVPWWWRPGPFHRRLHRREENGHTHEGMRETTIFQFRRRNRNA